MAYRHPGWGCDEWYDAIVERSAAAANATSVERARDERVPGRQGGGEHHSDSSGLRPGRDSGRKSRPTRSLSESEPFLYTPSDEIAHLIERTAKAEIQDSPVLLSGETGTGKTRMAHLIHELSPRRDEPFVSVNCVARQSRLLESELFGHVRGAFLGADCDRSGKLSLVRGGTLLLEDAHALRRTTQTMLLRAVTEKVIVPLGSDQTRTMQARVIAASPRDLAEEVAAGRFCPDLYRALSSIQFALPPLRERRDMIRPIARSFALRFGATSVQDASSIVEESLRGLEDYHWPGNIRELRNVIERALVLRGAPDAGS